MPFTGGGVLILRLGEIDLGFDGILCAVSGLGYANGWVLWSLTNIPLFLVQLHAPSVPFRDSLYIFVHLAFRALFSAASEMVPSRHLL